MNNPSINEKKDLFFLISAARHHLEKRVIVTSKWGELCLYLHILNPAHHFHFILMCGKHAAL